MSMLHAPPEGLALIRAVANMRVGWLTALAELIDNSLDAGAKNIAIGIGKTEFRVEDDGHGCDNPVRIVRIGDHQDHATTEIGEYGFGAKHALLWIGGEHSALTVRTDHAGLRSRLTMRWPEYARSWELRAPIVEDVAEHEGTHIKVHPCVRTPPYGQEWDRLRDELGYVFFSAIERGASISVKVGAKAAELLTPWSLPSLEKQVTTTVRIGDRSADVVCGIAQGPNPHCGFTYVRGWRVIERASANGTGGRNPSRVAGLVRLDPEWPIGTNKNEIVADSAALYDAVAEACEVILDEAHRRGRDITPARYHETVNDLLAGILDVPDRKARRNGKKNPGSGAAHPSGTGRRHKRAKVEQPGRTFGSNGKGDGHPPFEVTFDGFGSAHPVGSVSGRFIRLNLDNAGVAAAHAATDDRETVSQAIAVLASYAAANDGPQMLLGVTEHDDFLAIYGNLLHRMGNERARQSERDAA